MYWHECPELSAVTQETPARKFQISIRAGDFLPYASDEQQKMTRNNCIQPDHTILPHRNPNGALKIKSLTDNSDKSDKSFLKKKKP